MSWRLGGVPRGWGGQNLGVGETPTGKRDSAKEEEGVSKDGSWDPKGDIGIYRENKGTLTSA